MVDFRPGQLEAIYALMEEKKTTFAISPTEAGKSLLYLFNRVMTKTVLVFEPTLALYLSSIYLFTAPI